MPSIKDYKTPENKCTRCGKVNDLASNLKNVVLTPGSVSICFSYGHITIFKEDLTLREPTELEQIELKNDLEIQRIQAAIWLLKK